MHTKLQAIDEIHAILSIFSLEINGFLEENATAEGGRFTNVTLHPTVKVTDFAERAEALHKRAHQLCFLANSVNFPVKLRPTTERA
jgi:organic hydroperoxide reductase OsmC/OhrA